MLSAPKSGWYRVDYAPDLVIRSGAFFVVRADRVVRLYGETEDTAGDRKGRPYKENESFYRFQIKHFS